MYDLGENNDGVYYVMAYWGDDLRELMKAPLRQDWIIEIVKQLLKILAGFRVSFRTAWRNPDKER